MKVLLISPQDPSRPQAKHLKYLVGGENTYTLSLLANPPPGVTYITLKQAVKSGLVSYTILQKWYSWLIKLRLLPTDVGLYSLKVNRPFDLIHCHAFCIKLTNYQGPVVLSDSSSNWLYIKDYLGWQPLRIRLSYFLRRIVNRGLDMFDPNLNLKKASLVVWSNYAARIHKQLNIDPAKIKVIPPGLPDCKYLRKAHKGFNILFVGTWFERKGGPLLLAAFTKLKHKYPNLTADIISQVPSARRLPVGIFQRNWVENKRLVKEFIPRADVVVLTPPKAEGFGVIILEAARAGVPAIVSNIWALPELVVDNKTGFVIQPGNEIELINRIKILIKNKKLVIRLGTAARKRFETKWLVEKTNRQLLGVYKKSFRAG